MQPAPEAIKAMCNRIDKILHDATEPLNLTYLTIVTNSSPALVKSALDRLQQRSMAKQVDGGWATVTELEMPATISSKIVEFRPTAPKQSKITPIKQKSELKVLSPEVEEAIEKIPSYQLDRSSSCKPCTTARKFLNGSEIKPPAIVTVGEGNKAKKFFWGNSGLFNYWFFIKAPFSFPEVCQFLEGQL